MTIFTGKLAWALLAICWYVIRYPFERHASRTRTDQSRRDAAEWFRMAVSAIGLGGLPILYIATGWPRFASYQPMTVQMLAGMVVAVSALVMFRKTHLALGKYWSVSLDIRDGHRLITDGIYTKVRHPMYSAFWLMALAQALLIPNWFAGMAGLAGFGFLFFLRIGPEEKMMEERFGSEYITYRSHTNRIIPGIW